MRPIRPLVHPSSPRRPSCARGIPVSPIGRSGPSSLIDGVRVPHDVRCERRSPTGRPGAPLTGHIPCLAACPARGLRCLRSGRPDRCVLSFGWAWRLVSNRFTHDGDSRIEAVGTASPPLDSGRVEPLATVPGPRSWGGPRPVCGERGVASRRKPDRGARCPLIARSSLGRAGPHRRSVGRRPGLNRCSGGLIRAATRGRSASDPLSMSSLRRFQRSGTASTAT